MRFDPTRLRPSFFPGSAGPLWPRVAAGRGDRPTLGLPRIASSTTRLIEHFTGPSSSSDRIVVLRALDDLFPPSRRPAPATLCKVLLRVARDPSQPQAVRLKALEMMKAREVLEPSILPADLLIQLRGSRMLRDIRRCHLFIRDLPGDEVLLWMRSLLDAVLEERMRLTLPKGALSGGEQLRLKFLTEMVHDFRLDYNLRRLASDEAERLMNSGESMDLRGKAYLNAWVDRTNGLIALLGNVRIFRNPSGQFTRPAHLERVCFWIEMPTGRIVEVVPMQSVPGGMKPLPQHWFRGLIGRQVRHPLTLDPAFRPKVPRERLPFLPS